MNKKGFTMAELLGVVVIIGILVLVAFPPIIDQIRKSRNKLTEAAREVIYNSAEIYLKRNQNEFPIYPGNNFCFSLQTLVDSGELKISLLDYESGKNIDLNKIVKVHVKTESEFEYDIVGTGQCFIVDNTPIPNSDTSGASAPELVDGMIPVKWNGVNWIKADYRNPDNDYRWYNYNLKQWANVVVVNSLVRNDYKNGPIGMAIKDEDVLAYLVWIPRFNYELFNVSSHDPLNNPYPFDGIKIVFEDINDPQYVKNSGTNNGEILTHPAFTLGDKELTGFWVGKFETTGSSGLPTILPGESSLRNLNISSQYETANLFKNPTYGLNTLIDPRIMRNVEWGAVAFLAHSKYGKNSEIWNNPSSSYITGCAGEFILSSSSPNCSFNYSTINGQESSTTGNVYGVYDMVGGARESVMGAQFESNGTNIALGSSGFDGSLINSSNMESYINKYSYGTTTSDFSAYNRRILGDATGEVRGWNNDASTFINNTNPWFVRGGSHSDEEQSGIFAFGSYNGGASISVSFRVVISVNNN